METAAYTARAEARALSLMDFGGRDLPRRHWWRLSGKVHITPVGSRRQLTGESRCSSWRILAFAELSLDVIRGDMTVRIAFAA